MKKSMKINLVSFLIVFTFTQQCFADAGNDNCTKRIYSRYQGVFKDNNGNIKLEKQIKSIAWDGMVYLPGQHNFGDNTVYRYDVWVDRWENGSSRGTGGNVNVSCIVNKSSKVMGLEER